MIKQVRNDNEVLDILYMLQKEIQSEYLKYVKKKTNQEKIFKDEKFMDTDGIDILRDLEKELDNQIKTIKPWKANKVFQEKMAKVISDRKFQNKKEKEEIMEREQKE